MLLATGEQASIALLAMAIDSLGQPVISLTGPQGVFSLTRSTPRHGFAWWTGSDQRGAGSGTGCHCRGVSGLTPTNDIATLGRGGSDTTAVAVAAALDAEVCEIYTDVDGVYSADPRLVPEARKLVEVDYGEMLDLLPWEPWFYSLGLWK